MQRGEPSLECAVPGGVVRVSAQIVTQQQLIPGRQGTGLDNMQMVRPAPWQGRGGTKAGPASRCSETHTPASAGHPLARLPRPDHRSPGTASSHLTRTAARCSHSVSRCCFGRPLCLHSCLHRRGIPRPGLGSHARRPGGCQSAPHHRDELLPGPGPLHRKNPGYAPLVNARARSRSGGLPESAEYTTLSPEHEDYRRAQIAHR